MNFLTYTKILIQKCRRWVPATGLDPSGRHRTPLLTYLSTTLLYMATQLIPNHAIAQSITVKFNNAPIENVFDAVKKQSGYQFLFTKRQIKDAKKVTIDTKGKPLTQVLDELFKDQPFTYEIVDQTIVLKERKSTPPKTSQSGIDVEGTVINEDNKPLGGATIKVKDSQISGRTNEAGRFTLTDIPSDGIIEILYLGYTTTERNATPNLGTIMLKPVLNEISAIDVTVSTGYQNIPKERATGSFAFVDNELLNRRVSTNILDRIDGVTSGLIFNKGILDGSNKADISIRGRSTIFANPNPLIVLDNFPYDGDLSNINPNDIESITVLKDAAAASIWGVRAGNGVIVLTTKRGKKDSKPIINVTSNLSVADKPNLWYPAQMTSTEYIELERYLFDKGNYNNSLNNNYIAISPAVALMDQLKKNQVSQSEYNQEIAKFQQYDVRDDLNKYFYHNAFNQQYNVNVNGGNAYQKYFISGGFDRNQNSQVANNYNRFTLNANNTFNFFKDKLELFTRITLTKSKSENAQLNGVFTPYTPYDRFADENGNALSVVNNSTLRASYIASLPEGKLLDWNYRPLDERRPDRVSDMINYRLTTGLSYKILPSLQAQFNYQYEQGNTDAIRDYTKDSFFARDMINRFTTINQTTGVVSRVLPINGIRYENRSDYDSQYARFQLNFDKILYQKHQINAIAGYEFKDYGMDNDSQVYYGYDPIARTNVNGTINPLANYPLYYNPALTQRISTSPSQSGTIDRAISYYANASYSYDQKYVLSLSVRKDKTNIFGVKSNQKGVPLWSAGLSWNIAKESFYNWNDIPELKLRATYGYNGNTDKSISAYLTSAFAGLTMLNTSFSQVINPPNPSLGWEKVQNINFGLDFGAKDQRVTGSIDYYIKRGQDLIGESPIAPQTGVITFRGNSANTTTYGIDLVTNVKILAHSPVKWDATLLYSFTKDKVTVYKRLPANNGDLVFSNYSNPLVGHPYHSVFAFKYAGLDNTGSPLGYLDGEVSNNYTAIRNSFNREDITFMGSAVPTSYGGLRNTINYQQWSLSANVLYKFGYYFRRDNVFSGSSFTYQQSDYNRRWKQPGDEATTRVPSLTYPVAGFRDIIYQGSIDLIEKGDHIRLQDIRLSYRLDQSTISKLPFKRIEMFGYANNVGIIWRSNKKNIDPDAGTYQFPASRMYCFGLNFTL